MCRNGPWAPATALYQRDALLSREGPFVYDAASLESGLSLREKIRL
jgi:hypothetical protein